MVLIRSEGVWVPASLTSFDSESTLQELLRSDPSLIPGRAGAAAARELWIPGVGAVDLICVDGEGTITVVECKLKANPQIRREIVGQIIAYASGLQGSSYEDFDVAFTARAGTSLLDAVSAAAGSGVDAGVLRAAVEDRLAKGAFRLVVAVDQITPELRRSVEYLNEHLSDLVLFMALELGYLKSDGVEILIPQTYGAELESVKRHRAASPAHRWTADDVVAAVAAIPDEAERSFVEGLLRHADGRQAVVKGGVGASPSAGYYYLVAGKRRSVWSLYVKPEGPVIALNPGSVQNAAPHLAEAMAGELAQAKLFAERLGQKEETTKGSR
jgi:hypothetical protein